MIALPAEVSGDPAAEVLGVVDDDRGVIRVKSGRWFKVIPVAGALRNPNGSHLSHEVMLGVTLPGVADDERCPAHPACRNTLHHSLAIPEHERVGRTKRDGQVDPLANGNGRAGPQVAGSW